ENKEGFSSSEAAKNGFYYEYHKENGKKLVFDDISVLLSVAMAIFAVRRALIC
ncbi:hypothetical protein METSMIF1_03746, partial [Methanobrevibacter smithii DSM 2374]